MDAAPQDVRAATALALLASRRGLLVERASLAAHDILASEGVAFSRVREACDAALDLVAATLVDPRGEAPASLDLERLIAGAIHKGVPLESVVRALHAGLSSFLAVAVEQPAGPPSDELLVAASRVVQRLGGVAGTAVDAAHRTALRRRAALIDRMRGAAHAFSTASLELDQAAADLARATVDALRCDWAGIAFPEADGRYVIASAIGRGAGWTQRWSLRADSGFPSEALASQGAVLVSDPAAIPFEGDDRPLALLAVALRDASRQPTALLFAGRDAGEAFGLDDLTLADSIADVAGRTLEAAREAGVARRLSAQLVALRHAGSAALRGDEAGALGMLATAAARLARSDVALLRLAEPERGLLVTRAVHAESPALAAELAGTSDALDGPVVTSLMAGEELELTDTRALGTLARLPSESICALALPVAVAGSIVGSLELVRLRREGFAEDEREHARYVVGQAALVLALGGRKHAEPVAGASLDVIADALVAGSTVPTAARAIARHGAAAAGARGAAVFALQVDDELARAGVDGSPDELSGPDAQALAVEALRRDEAVLGVGEQSVLLALALHGRSDAAGVLVLLFADRRAAVAAMSSAALAVFASRAGEALARAAEADRVRQRLGHVAALYDAAAPVGQLAPVDLVAAALRAVGAGKGGAFVRSDDERLTPLALVGTDERVGSLVASLLDEALERGEPVVRPDLAADGRLAAAARAAGIGAAVVAPLRYGGDPIGALALLYEQGPVAADATEVAARLAAPLAAVAAADERGRRAGELSREARDSHAAARRLDAFDLLAEAMLAGEPLDAALARAAAMAARGAAAAVQHLDRKGRLTPVALHVEPGAPAESVRRVLEVGLSPDSPPVARALAGESLLLDPDHEVSGALAPFVRAGSTVAIVPVGAPGSVRGVLVTISLDPSRPLEESDARALRRLAAF
jgi:hypothetical protein